MIRHGGQEGPTTATATVAPSRRINVVIVVVDALPMTLHQQPLLLASTLRARFKLPLQLFPRRHLRWRGRGGDAGTRHPGVRPCSPNSSMVEMTVTKTMTGLEGRRTDLGGNDDAAIAVANMMMMMTTTT